MAGTSNEGETLLAHQLRALALSLLALLLPGGAEGQSIFNWPIRAVPYPEALLVGAPAAFWNPGGLARSSGGESELWIIHVDGPDATGVGGVALATALHLPLGLTAGLGYSHLGVSDIPRTTTSPQAEPGGIQVAEETGTLALAGSLGRVGGVGGAIHLRRAWAGEERRTGAGGSAGLHLRLPLPLQPRVGVAVEAAGGESFLSGGTEISFPPLASARLPLRAAWGWRTDHGRGAVEQRVSLRGSWEEHVHLGMGLTRMAGGAGWSPLWMVGADLDRYSLAVLREGLAPGFGSIHFFRAAIRLR